MLEYIKYSLWFHTLSWCVIVVTVSYVVLDQMGS